jgi:hypothetical protein
MTGNVTDARTHQPEGSEASSPLAAPSTPTVVRPMALPVLHLHRLGSCRGRLVVSRTAVAFVPDDRKGNAEDGFSVRPGEFLHELGDDVLTIKSNDRTYRFKPAEGTGTDPDPRLKRLVAAMARIR